ncbi:MAG: HPr kinase/phosphorylase [Rhizobacter sp.]|nr:HPr kinase/phosphorylase [Chlorobiales bacterium]
MDLDKKPLKKKFITVDFLYERLSSRLGIDLERMNKVSESERRITERDIHRPGLALAGFTNLFTYQRVQIFGNTETRFLNHLPPVKRIKAFANIATFKVPCIVVTDKNKLEPKLLALATAAGIPVFRTTLTTTKFIYLISDFLDDQFAPHQTYHGSMLDVYGIGMLFVGRSGIGKSEIALDLIERGHRLVADDAVVITRKGESVLMAAGTDLVKHFMEIRGLGIINIEAMFGVRAIRFQKRVELIVELMEWDGTQEYTRTGFERDTALLLGVEIPVVKLPIFPGKNVTVIAEVIALNYLLKHYGYDAAEELDKRIKQKIATGAVGGKASPNGLSGRAIEYFEHDFE